MFFKCLTQISIADIFVFKIDVNDAPYERFQYWVSQKL